MPDIRLGDAQRPQLRLPFGDDDVVVELSCAVAVAVAVAVAQQSCMG